MAEFHFLRPLWLLALPVGVWLIFRITRGGSAAGRWQAVVDEALQPFVLTGVDTTFRRNSWLFASAVVAWVLATVALAGPTWERVPVPAYRSSEALVVVLDLSRSMDAADVEPSRLARAKLKLLSLLDRRDAGQTGLVVYSAHAFTVTSLTMDTRTIAALVSSLSSDIMPSRGSYPEAGLSRAARLIRQAGIERGEILLLTDTAVSPGALELAEELRLDGFTLHVLAVGTAEGGPISQPGGGFLTDGTGQVVVSRVDLAALRELASAGGGRFATLSPDDRDLDQLFPENAVAGGVLAADAEDLRTEVWRDQGSWLVLLLLPMVALAFRRGWIVVWIVGLSLPGPPANALTWMDLWQRPDQQGEKAFAAEDHERAGRLFEDAEWRAAAQYRAGDFEASATSLAGVETPEGHYNRGNALARAGSIPEAIQAYERALELDAAHEDAQFNRDLLRQQPPEDSQEQNAQQGDQSEQDPSGDPSQSNAQSEPGEDGEPQDDETGEAGEPQDSEQLAAENQEAPPADEAMPTPGELEEWASEQAAEQWLRRIPEDPGGLLRRKFLYQYQRLGIDQDGNYVWPGDEEQPW